MTRRFRRRPSRAYLLSAVLLLAVALRYTCDRLADREAFPRPVVLQEGPCEVVRVVDGDTLIVRQQSHDPPGPAPTTYQARLRLLGVDCPESAKPNHPVEAWGPEATAFTERFVSEGPIRLRFDRRRVDRYDRFLAYVYVGDRMLNMELVRAGLARVRTFAGDSHSMARQLRSAEDEARSTGRGIWSHRTPAMDR